MKKILQVLPAAAVAWLGLSGCAADAMDERELAVVREFNEYRASLGVGPVEPDDCLASAANEQAVGMQAMQAYKPGLPRDHSGLDGSDISDRAERAGCGVVFAEISAWGEDPVESWKGSPGHNAVMIDPGYQLVGVAIVGTITIAVFAP